MIRLKNNYSGQSALIVMGGPSIIENNYDLGRIDKSRYTVFVESKALTPRLLDSGLKPDYFLMCFPDKCKDNQLQHFIFRSFLAGSNIRPLLKREFAGEAVEMRKNFDTYFEEWNPAKGAHKRFRWKPNVFMKGSPYDVLGHLPEAKIIARRDLLTHYFPDCNYPNQAHFYDLSNELRSFDLETYFNPSEQDGRVVLGHNTFLNSAAISIYPLLNFMGFSEAYFIGMDMSNLGSMEYAAPYIFRSMLHFWWYILRNKRAFNSGYRMNKPFYFRPKSEFEDLRLVFNASKVKMTRIYDNCKYAAPVAGIPTISFEQFVAGNNS